MNLTMNPQDQPTIKNKKHERSFVSELGARGLSQWHRLEALCLAPFVPWHDLDALFSPGWLSDEDLLEVHASLRAAGPVALMTAT